MDEISLTEGDLSILKGKTNLCKYSEGRFGGHTCQNVSVPRNAPDTSATMKKLCMLASVLHH